MTITMLRAIGDPIDVHEIDHAVMRTAIERLQEIHHELASTNKVRAESTR